MSKPDPDVTPSEWDVWCSKVLAETNELDASFVAAAEMPAEAFNKDLLALVEAVRDVVNQAVNEACPEIVELAAALEQFEPWLEQDEDPRSMGWVDDRGRP